MILIYFLQFMNKFLCVIINCIFVKNIAMIHTYIIQVKYFNYFKLNFLKYFYIIQNICICIPESFYTNNSHQLFDYIRTFMNQHSTCSTRIQIPKTILYLKTGFKRYSKDFWYTKKNPTQIWYDEFN